MQEAKERKTCIHSFDSWANQSCIHADLLNELEALVQLGRIRQLSTASEGHYSEVSHAVRLDFYLQDVLLSDEFLMVPGLSE